MCGCTLNQRRRVGAFNLVVALAILAAPVLGAVMYHRFDREPNTGQGAALTAAIGSPAESGDWSRLVTSTLNGSRFAMADLTGKPAAPRFFR